MFLYYGIIWFLIGQKVHFIISAESLLFDYSMQSASSNLQCEVCHAVDNSYWFGLKLFYCACIANSMRLVFLTIFSFLSRFVTRPFSWNSCLKWSKKEWSCQIFLMFIAEKVWRRCSLTGEQGLKQVPVHFVGTTSSNWCLFGPNLLWCFAYE